MNYDLVVRAERAIIDGRERSAVVAVVDGRIVAIDELEKSVSATEERTLGQDQVLVPGIVDCHVHINEPGRTHWEGFATATAAAAAGGVTTVIDMPLNSLPPTLTPEALNIKRDVARGQARVDLGFWGGAVPANLEKLPDLFAAGVFGVKCFLQDSGVPEFPPLSTPELKRATEIIAGIGGLLLVHAEDPGVLAHAPNPQGRDYRAFVASRPPEAEATAIGAVIEASRRTGCRVHIVHLSSAAGVELVRSAKADGVAITAETCPHYLTLDAETIPDGSPQFKCCPPIRGRRDQDALWAGLADGTIDIVVTDHSPAPADIKQMTVGDLGTAWGGVSSLQFGFAVVWTAARRRGIPLTDVVGWMSTGTADLVGLEQKGRIAVGADADLVILADGDQFDVQLGDIRHRHPITPYLGATLAGRVHEVFLHGRPLREGEIRGTLLAP